MKQKEVGLQLCSLANLIKRWVQNSTNFQYAESITGTNSWIIAYLAENSSSDIFQKDLEKQFSITRSTASKVIKLMEQKGLIERCSVPHDARLKKLSLTPKALEMHHAIEQDIKKLEAALVKTFSPEEIDDLLSYVGRMKANVEDI